MQLAGRALTMSQPCDSRTLPSGCSWERWQHPAQALPEHRTPMAARPDKRRSASQGTGSGQPAAGGDFKASGSQLESQSKSFHDFQL